MGLARLIHRKQERSVPAAAGEDVDSGRPEPLAHHVTTEALKRQFEERFASRRRRRGIKSR
jgi:hypothetical protein